MVKYNNTGNNTMECRGEEVNHTSFRNPEKRNPLQNKKANNKKAISQGKMMVQSLQQAIIWSEILDKPVSRRRRSKAHGN